MICFYKERSEKWAYLFFKDRWGCKILEAYRQDETDKREFFKVLLTMNSQTMLLHEGDTCKPYKI